MNPESENLEQMKEENRQLRSLLGSIQEVVWSALPGAYAATYISPAFEKVWGIPAEVVMRKPELFLESIHPEDQAEFLEKVAQQAQGIASNCEYRIRRPDGTQRWIWDRGFPLLDSAGKVVRIDGIAADITERRQIQEQERQGRNALEMLARGASLENVLGAIVAYAESAQPNCRCAVLLLNAQHDGFILGNGGSLSPDVIQAVLETPVGESCGGCGAAAALRRPVELDEIATATVPDAFKTAALASGFFSSWSKPIFSRSGAILGTMETYSLTRKAPSQAERESANFAANLASIAIDHKRSEAALRASEESLRILGDNLPGGYLYQAVRGENHQTSFRYLSQGVEQIHQVAREAIMENPGLLYATIHPDDIQDLSRREIESETWFSPFNATARIVRADGSMRWVEFHSAPRRLDDKTILWDGVALDITDRKKAESEAELQRLRVTGIIDSAMDGIITIDDEHRIVVFNESAERIFDCSAEEALGTKIDRFVPERFRGNHGKQIQDFGKTGQTNRPMGRMGKVSGLRNNGQEFPLEAAISQLDLEGQKLFTITCRDMTERHKAEQEREQLERQLRQSQKMEALGTLAGGIAHDFNNILGALLGNLHLALLDVVPGHPAHESLLESRKAGERAKHLVTQILAFSRQQSQERSVIQIAPVVEEAASLLKAMIPSGILINTRLSPDVPYVLADSTQIHQVLLNLCTNAWHAMEGGRGHIEIGLDTFEAAESGAGFIQGLPPGRCARISVKDDGCGMSQEVLDRIFEPFFSTKGPGKGTGLGLAVVHGIIKAHGGAIRTESAPGKGTTFQILLPAVTGPAQPAQQTPAAPPSGGREQILYLDDETSLVRLVTRSLQRLGYQVTGATQPEEALDKIRQEPGKFDLVITDLNMPQFSGFEFITRVQSIRPGIQIILISGHLTEDYLARAKELGVQTILRKPVSLEELAEGVRQALGKR